MAEKEETERYKAIKSNYLKDKIKGASWISDHKHIDDLVLLEGFVINGPKSFASAGLYNHLKVKYSNDYYELLKELQPKRFEEESERSKEAAKNLLRQSEEAREYLTNREQRLKKEWFVMGGKE